MTELTDEADALLEPVRLLLTGSVYDRWLLIAMLAAATMDADVLRRARDAIERIGRYNEISVDSERFHAFELGAG